MKLWQGILPSEVDMEAEDFNKSIDIDKKMVYQDIKGSLAHAKMLGKTNILEESEVKEIIKGLEGIDKDLREGKLEVDLSSEDIHTFVEVELTKRIGEAGKKLHTARSRNDQVSTDLRLTLVDEIDEINDLLNSYIEALLELINDNIYTIMPGYTHLQAAQPVTLAHHTLSYVMMALRDMERLKEARKRTNQSPLGACALAGTTYPIDREYTAKLLGFEQVMENSMDAVSDRDFVLELLGIISIISSHLSRQAEELIIWTSQPFQFVKIDSKYSTGSSIMPQKKNPDMAELIRGKTSRVYGNLMQGLTMMKGLSLAYSKDLQEDKEAIFDSIETVKHCISIMTKMLKTLEVNKEKMLNQANYGYLNATDVADYLVNKKVPFRDAHHIAQELVNLAIEKDEPLNELTIEEYRSKSSLFNEDIYEKIDLVECVKMRKSQGGPEAKEVVRQINWVKEKLKNIKGENNEKKFS